MIREVGAAKNNIIAKRILAGSYISECRSFSAGHDKVDKKNLGLARTGMREARRAGNG